MINFLGCSAQGIAVANGVITLALLEHMVEKKISGACRCARNSRKRHRVPSAAHQCWICRRGGPPDARPNAPVIRRIGLKAISVAPCPLWVMSGHRSADRGCPLYP